MSDKKKIGQPFLGGQLFRLLANVRDASPKGERTVIVVKARVGEGCSRDAGFGGYSSAQLAEHLAGAKAREAVEVEGVRAWGLIGHKAVLSDFSNFRRSPPGAGFGLRLTVPFSHSNSFNSKLPRNLNLLNSLLVLVL